MDTESSSTRTSAPLSRCLVCHPPLSSKSCPVESRLDYQVEVIEEQGTIGGDREGLIALIKLPLVHPLTWCRKRIHSWFNTSRKLRLGGDLEVAGCGDHGRPEVR